MLKAGLASTLGSGPAPALARAPLLRGVGGR